MSSGANNARGHPIHTDGMSGCPLAVCMGCPLAPTMANFLSRHMEIKMLKKQTPDQPQMHVRYINIFAGFDSDNACLSFLEILNNQHTNISRTIEKSKNTLQFLDMVIQINHNRSLGYTWV